MSDKQLSEATDDELLLELLEQYKEKNSKLEQDLKNKNRPWFDGKGIKKAFDHWTWAALVVISILTAIVVGIIYIWPSTYETGRFYLEHRTWNYGKAPICQCPPVPKEFDDCYRVIKEVENGGDETMTDCMRNKDEAYEAANEFADEWRGLKLKSKGVDND